MSRSRVPMLNHFDEQNTRLALAVADHVLVLHKGAVVLSGTLEEFRRDEAALRGSHLAV